MATANVPYTFSETGTFQPGHNYTLSISARSASTLGGLGVAQSSRGVADIILTVPEPASLALLAPAAGLLLGRRRRR